VQIAIAIPSLSAEEKDAGRDAERPPRIDAGLKFLVIFFTHEANLSACVIINLRD
jgi:hypothetical protein